MIANYHAHTFRCRHATGTDVEYVLSALEKGLKIFGFSDHTPQFFPGSYYSYMRMFPEQLEEYCQSVRALRETFRGHIEIPLGLEVEYYPDIFPNLLPRLRDAGIEYMILGQHWVGNEENELYCGSPTEDETQLRRYCDQAIAAMETGLFTYLAHPGLLQFVGDRAVYERHMRRLCRTAVQTSTPVEVNLLGIRSSRHYPTEAFWEIAGEEGCSAVLGIDAHSPQEIADDTAEPIALALLKKYNIPLLETVPLKKL